MGGATLGALPDDDQSVPDGGRGVVHRERLRGPESRCFGRIGGGCHAAERRHPELPRSADDRRHGAGLGELRGSRRRAAGAGARGTAARCGHALQLGHDRPSEGHPAAAARRSGLGASARVRCIDRRSLRDRPRFRLPLAGAALPLGAAGLHDGGAGARRHGDRDGEVRPRARAALHPGLPRHGQPVGADHVHPHAQTARGGPLALRPVESPDRHSRRRPLSGGRQAPHDRVVGTDHPRVLRRHRRQRHVLHRLRKLAQKAGLGGQVRQRHAPHLQRRRRRAPDRRRGGHLHRAGRGDRALRVSQRCGPDPGLPEPEDSPLDDPRRCGLRR